MCMFVKSYNVIVITLWLRSMCLRYLYTIRRCFYNIILSVSKVARPMVEDVVGVLWGGSEWKEVSRNTLTSGEDQKPPTSARP